MAPPQSEKRLQIVQANGIEVGYEVRGDGPWLVLSHSLACNRTMWDEQMDALASAYRVLRYDTRGHGHSTATPGPYTLDMLADDLLALLDRLRIDKPNFIGLSMGGMIGQMLAIRHPGVLRTLVLCDTTSSYPPQTAALWQERIETARTHGLPGLVDSTLQRWFTESFRKREPAVMKRFGDMISGTSTDGYIGCSQALVQINVTAHLKKLTLPSLVVVGEHDKGTPVAMARTIHENLPGSEFALIRDAGHISNVEQPGEFTKVVIDFLRKRQADTEAISK